MSSARALSSLRLPDSLNYIGVFLTIDCNLNCAYCINDPQQSGDRGKVFRIHRQRELSPAQWARGLSRIPFSPDLPLTLQGGEPMLYQKGQGVGLLLEGLPHYFDLLTNLTMKPEAFSESLRGQHAKLMRDAPYPSIRVSYHGDEMNRIWKDRGFAELVDRCEQLAQFGFRVAPVKNDSDVGIYMVEHPDNPPSDALAPIAAGRVPFETKEFLGVHAGKLFGHYRYPFSTDLIVRQIHPQPLECECRTSELLLDPLGFVWGCHLYLYETWKSGGMQTEFDRLQAADFRLKANYAQICGDAPYLPVGHILDPDFDMTDLAAFHTCRYYGLCIGCDTKIKNDRFQNYYDRAIAHTSVEIRGIRMPQALLAKLDQDERTAPFLIAIPD